ncbi:uncharacterized protein [Clytia hemisphaerica]|uniref:uncharacterized protein n=1 Tax=Clytia hemisphaerica TaxID=252671 RepID=UPI0034D72807
MIRDPNISQKLKVVFQMETFPGVNDITGRLDQSLPASCNMVPLDSLTKDGHSTSPELTAENYPNIFQLFKIYNPSQSNNTIPASTTTCTLHSRQYRISELDGKNPELTATKYILRERPLPDSPSKLKKVSSSESIVKDGLCIDRNILRYDRDSKTELDSKFNFINFDTNFNKKSSLNLLHGTFPLALKTDTDKPARLVHRKIKPNALRQPSLPKFNHISHFTKLLHAERKKRNRPCPIDLVFDSHNCGDANLKIFEHESFPLFPHRLRMVDESRYLSGLDRSNIFEMMQSQKLEDEKSPDSNETIHHTTDNHRKIDRTSMLNIGENALQCAPKDSLNSHQFPSERSLEVGENTQTENSENHRLLSPSPAIFENVSQTDKVLSPYFSLSTTTSDSLLFSLKAIKKRRMQAKK